jgi:pimeloyl-ACP methyl ester carboxylesterase
VCLACAERGSIISATELMRPAGSSAEPAHVSAGSNTFRALMRHLGIERTHIVGIVGHSASACICLQIALDVPESVHSVAVLEPALMVGASVGRLLRSSPDWRAGSLTLDFLNEPRTGSRSYPLHRPTASPVLEITNESLLSPETIPGRG